jgi:uncharacterized NAD-dependent epimerase/dehydratase family protein
VEVIPGVVVICHGVETTIILGAVEIPGLAAVIQIVVIVPGVIITGVMVGATAMDGVT